LGNEKAAFSKLGENQYRNFKLFGIKRQRPKQLVFLPSLLVVFRSIGSAFSSRFLGRIALRHIPSHYYRFAFLNK